MKIPIIAISCLALWTGAAHADMTPAVVALKTQFEAIATQADTESADADQAFMYGAEEDGCGYLKDAADDYALATGLLQQIRAEVETGGSASDDPQATQLQQLDIAITKYQGFETDTRATLTIACE